MQIQIDENDILHIACCLRGRLTKLEELLKSRAVKPMDEVNQNLIAMVKGEEAALHRVYTQLLAS